jgi:hypothetical protein
LQTSVHSLLSSHLLSNNIKIKIYKTIILLVLCGCETWFVTLREEGKLRGFENRVLKRILGPKREEGAGNWRKLYSEELHNLCALPDIIRVIKSRRIRWAGHVAWTGGMRNAYKMLVRKSEGKIPLWIPGHRWEDNIRMNLGETVWESADWMNLSQDRVQWQALVNMVMNLWVS